MTAETVAKTLAGRKTMSTWMAGWLVHKDREPSLSITDARGGKVLVHYPAGCDQAVVSGIKASGVHGQPRTPVR